MMMLDALEARAGDRPTALRSTEEIVSTRPDVVRAGGMEVALLRRLQRKAEASKRLAFWKGQDPTNSFLRYESIQLDQSDPGLMPHLPADPERILEIATDYMRFGLYEDALDVISRDYPSGPEVSGEPGLRHPSSYPLIAYYRGFCRYALGKDGSADFAAASSMPTSYVFPNRPESFAVLHHAVEVNPSDATAHFLLGSLYLSGGMSKQALQEWETTRGIKPVIPTLHRDMGYTILKSGESPERAIELFREGMKYDPHNVDLYLGLEEAVERAGQPVSERARALQSFQELQSAPAVLVFRLVRLLGDAGEFDEAEKQLVDRFFPREEGGANVREIYVGLRLRRARTIAAQRQCPSALDIVRHLGEPVASLPFTSKGLDLFISSAASKQAVKEIQALCR